MPTLEEIKEQGLGLTTGSLTSTKAVDPFSDKLTAAESVSQELQQRDVLYAYDRRQRDLRGISFVDQVGLSMKLRNSVGNLFQTIQNMGFESAINPEEGFNKWEYLDELGISDRLQVDVFSGANSKPMIDRLYSQLKERQFAEEVLQANGVNGILASFGSEVFEPLNYLVVGRAVGAAGKGLGLAKTSGKAALEAGVSEVGIQAAMATNQGERTLQDATIEVAAGALGGAVLGSAGYAVARSLGKTDNDIAAAVVGSMSEEGQQMVQGGQAMYEAPEGSAGAMRATKQGDGVKLSGNRVYKAVVGFTGQLTPGLRNLNSVNLDMVRATTDLVDTGVRKESGNIRQEAEVVDGEFREAGTFDAVERSVEAETLRLQDTLLAKATKGSNEAYKELVGIKPGVLGTAVDVATAGAVRRSRKDVLGPTDFHSFVGKAMARGDDIRGPDGTDTPLAPNGRPLTEKEINAINKAAKSWRNELFTPMKDRLVDVGLLPEGVTPEFADSYFTRVYDVDKIKSRPTEWKNSLRGWAEKTFDDMPEILKKELDEARASGNKERVDELQKEINYFKNTNNKEDFLIDMASETASKITSGTTTMFTKFKPKTRGAMKEITLTVDDVDIEGFLVRDVRQVAPRFLRISSGEWGLMSKFGTTRAEDVIDGTVGNYHLRERGQRAVRDLAFKFDVEIDNARAANKNPKEIQKIINKRDKEVKSLTNRLQREEDDFRVMWDLIRGTYQASSESPDSGLRRGLSATRALAMLAFLGNVVMSSISDLAMPVFVHGLGDTIKHGYIPMIRKLVDPEFKAAMMKNKEQLREAGLVVQHLTNSRFVQLFMMDSPNVAGQSFIERGIHKMSGGFGDVTGMNFWNNFGQEVSGTITQQRMFRLAKAKKLTKDDASWLSSIGISSEDLTKIRQSLDENGYVEGGLTVANLDSWDDKALVDTINSATFRDNRSMILQKGAGDVPLLMNTEMGKTLGQFMTHAAVSHNRIFNSSLQRADKNVLMGMTNLVALGTLSYYLNTLAAGRELSDDWRVWVAEGLDRSSIISVGMMGNDSLLEPSGLGISNLVEDENFKKYDKRGVPLDGLGAMGGYVESVFRSAQAVGNIAVNGGATEGQINRIFTPAPFRLTPGFRQFFDGVTNHLIEEYGE